jgi:hypothetical protein
MPGPGVIGMAMSNDCPVNPTAHRVDEDIPGWAVKPLRGGSQDIFWPDHPLTMDQPPKTDKF